MTLEGLEKTFGRGTRVVKGIDLHIEDGELVTLVGPSGCGKSTLLNLIAGLERPTGGHVRIDGRIVDALSPKERGVAMVFQSYALYPHLTVRKNIAFPLEIEGLTRAEIERRVAETAERLGIAALLDRKPKELSGGQRQRVALGRAIVRRPTLCLFDEPLSNLDAALRAQMRVEIKKLHESLKATFVYVTHDQAEAMTLSDRVVVLHEGVVAQEAPPREIYARPANLFVAKFLGAPRLNVAEPSVFGLASRARGRDVLVGLRPEDVTIGEGSPPETAPNGRVYVTEPMGGETWVTVDVGGEHVIARAPADYEASSGTPVWLSFDPSRALLFDRTTEQRLET
ncbi:Various polyols ABC transporter, ATP-binding component [Labilithrix luteola]|uniref:Various polyols ABC transporter, ATP-binding component n=1 Tax=Labilithrix luteola TaxID=1391654 RepID=A0A0K1PYM8_9BACT|nr:Various polyols ABC transporter, ATP-binding component [Labilithrix luteola]